MPEFKVGDKVTHAVYGDGEIKYGPFRHMYGSGEDCYVFSPDNRDAGVTSPCYRLTPRPAFKVGDKASYKGLKTVNILAGPFSDNEAGPWYVAHFPDGEDDVAYESTLSPWVPVFHKDPDPAPLKAAEDTETFSGVTYVMGARYKDRTGDFWEFARRDDGRVTGEWFYSNGDPGESGWCLENAVEHFGPLTLVED